jgi:hypothetical protein
MVRSRADLADRAPFDRENLVRVNEFRLAVQDNRSIISMKWLLRKAS